MSGWEGEEGEEEEEDEDEEEEEDDVDCVAFCVGPKKCGTAAEGVVVETDKLGCGEVNCCDRRADIAVVCRYWRDARGRNSSLIKKEDMQVNAAARTSRYGDIRCLEREVIIEL